MGFRLVPKSVTLNDLERRYGSVVRYFAEFASPLIRVSEIHQLLTVQVLNFKTIANVITSAGGPSGGRRPVCLGWPPMKTQGTT